MRRRAWLSALAIAPAVALLSFAADEPRAGTRPETVLKGGTRRRCARRPSARVVDLVIRDGRIVALGKVDPGPGARVIDATGLVVAPGFIDLHNHSDNPIVNEATRDNRNYQAQGVTTVVTGNCGAGALDVEKFFEAINKHGNPGTNVIPPDPPGRRP